MDNIITLLDMINDTKEKEDIIKELIKIGEYKIYYLKTHSTTKEIDDFIKKTVDKYRNNIILKDYYCSDSDNLDTDRFELLCLLEHMICNYVCRKIALDNNK